MKRICLIVLAMSLSACGTLSMTRESPLVKKKYDYSLGGGMLGAPAVYHGGIARDSSRNYGSYAGIRFGLSDSVELMGSGSLLYASGSAYELRGKWQWFDEQMWVIASSLYALSEQTSPNGTQQSYSTNGVGLSTSAGIRWNPATTLYFGGKVTSLTLHYEDDHFIPANDHKFSGVSPAAFGGVSYQYYIGGVPFEGDFMATFIMLPKNVGDDTLTVYPAATASIWWRH